MPEMDALKLTEAWLKNPLPDLHGGILGCLGKVDFTGPAGWAAQAAAWVKMPGMPPGLVAAAVAEPYFWAAGLKIGAGDATVSTAENGFADAASRA